MRSLILATLLLLTSTAIAYEWRDTPLMNRLKSISGKRVLVGLQKLPANSDINASDTLKGVVPAVQAFDLCGFSLVNRDEQDARVVQGHIDRAKAWIDRGGVAAFHWHWPDPMNDLANAWLKRPHDRKEDAQPFSLKLAVQPGAPENLAVNRDIDWVAGFLKQLGDREYLFRPLWEMEGGWFWWGAYEPFTGNTPEDYRAFSIYVRDRFENHHGLKSAIWLYSMAPTVTGLGHHLNGLDVRKRCYPGDWDVMGFSIYPNGANKWGEPEGSDWRGAYEIAKAVDPGKPYTISECQRLPNPDLMARHDEKPIYALHWYDGPKQTTEYAGHPLYLGMNEWNGRQPEPTPDPTPNVILELPEPTRYDGSNPEAFELEQPLDPPFTVQFRFRRNQIGTKKHPVGICEAVRFTTGGPGPIAHCDIGEPEWFAVRNRCMDKTVPKPVTEKRKTPFAFLQNGSTPAKETQANPVVWKVGEWHHAALVFDYWGEGRELLAYLDDNPRTIQGPTPRDEVGAGFTEIVVGRSNPQGHELEISDLVITKGATPLAEIQERARRLAGNTPEPVEPEPEPLVERGRYELTEDGETRVLVLTKE